MVAMFKLPPARDPNSDRFDGQRCQADALPLARWQVLIGKPICCANLVSGFPCGRRDLRACRISPCPGPCRRKIPTTFAARLFPLPFGHRRCCPWHRRPVQHRGGVRSDCSRLPLPAIYVSDVQPIMDPTVDLNNLLQMDSSITAPRSNSVAESLVSAKGT